jgi:Domain of unknown function (DUF4388)
MALHGSLADISLPDVIQLVSVSGKTGVFILSSEGMDGKIFLKDGQIADATVGKLSGELAVYEMAAWRKGQFIFTANIEPARVTVTKSNTNLMMEAARRLDEFRVLQRKIPSMDAVPFFLPRDPGQDQITLAPQEWAVVTKIDGQLSIKQLEDATGLPAFEICKVLYGLVTSGLISIRAVESGAEGLAQGPPPEPPEQGTEPRAAQVPTPGLSVRSLFALADNVRKVADECVGLSGSIAVEKQYRVARADIEAGKGLVSVQALVDRLARAISLLEGGDKAGEFLRKVHPLLQP